MSMGTQGKQGSNQQGRNTRLARRRILLAGAALAVTNLAAAWTAQAITYTWNGASGSSFESASNWLPATSFPGTADIARFDGKVGGDLSITWGSSVGGANGLFIDVTANQ